MPENKSESQRFFDPDYIPDADTIKAVRILISDWQGDNKSAVHHALRQMGYPRDEIDAMTGMDVRMAFCSAPVMLKIDKCVETTTGTISRIDYGQSKPDTHKRGPKVVYDPVKDKKLVDDWRSSNPPMTMAQYESARDKPAGEIKRAIDRLRKH